MPFTEVSKRSVILMKPRSVVCTPASLSPIDSMFGARPAATRTLSKVSAFFSPFTSTGMVTFALPFLMVPSLAPVITSIPRFLNDLASSTEQSSSSTGRMRGITSRIVTLEPKALKTSANSQPTAPAPITARVAGAASRVSASSDESTSVLSSSSPICGSPFTREPVAITTPLVAVCVSMVPSAAVTFTLLFAPRTPVPLSQVILFFLKRNSTPLEFCAETARERFMATP